MTARRLKKAACYHLVKLDGKGRAVSLTTRKTLTAIERAENAALARNENAFIVGEYEERGGDTVWFFDLGGGEVDMAS